MSAVKNARQTLAEAKHVMREFLVAVLAREGVADPASYADAFERAVDGDDRAAKALCFDDELPREQQTILLSLLSFVGKARTAYDAASRLAERDDSVQNWLAVARTARRCGFTSIEAKARERSAAAKSNPSASAAAAPVNATVGFCLTCGKPFGGLMRAKRTQVSTGFLCKECVSRVARLASGTDAKRAEIWRMDKVGSESDAELRGMLAAWATAPAIAVPAARILADARPEDALRIAGTAMRAADDDTQVELLTFILDPSLLKADGLERLRILFAPAH